MIVVGSGSSSRFGTDKLMVDVGGRPLIQHTIDAVATHVDTCVVVCRPEISEAVASVREDIVITTGGATRTASELAGLAALDDRFDLIGIHDAARPVVHGGTIDRLFEVADTHGGALPLLANEELIIDRDSLEPVDGLHRAQTPQVFRAIELQAAYRRADKSGFEGYDTVEVMEKFSDVTIVGVEGDAANLKVTYPSDLPRVRGALTGPSRT